MMPRIPARLSGEITKENVTYSEFLAHSLTDADQNFCNSSPTGFLLRFLFHFFDGLFLYHFNFQNDFDLITHEHSATI